MVGGNTQGDRLARVEAYLGMNADGTEAITPDCVADRLNQGQYLIEILKVEVEALRREQETLRKEAKVSRQEVEILKKAVATPTAAEPSVGRSKVPDPKAFTGARDAKELKNFLWDMEQYFRAAHIPDREKVSLTSMYLTGNVKL